MEDIQNSSSNPSLSGLGALLSDPAAIARIGAALGKLGITGGNADEAAKASGDASHGQGEIGDAPSDTAPSLAPEEHSGTSPAETASSTPDGLPFSISPELMSRLPALISSLGASFGTSGAPSLASASKGSALSHQHNRRIALLNALRPYLSEHRRQAIDQIIKINALGDLLKKLK